MKQISKELPGAVAMKGTIGIGRAAQFVKDQERLREVANRLKESNVNMIALRGGMGVLMPDPAIPGI